MTYKEPVAPVRVLAPSPSLLTSAFEARWEYSAYRTGIEWMSDVCQPSYLEELCAPYDDDEGREAAGTRVRSTTVPFTVYTPFACEELTPESAAKFEDSLREIALARRAYMLARALWMGEGVPSSVTDSEGTEVLPATLRDVATDVSVGGGADDIDDVFAQLLLAYEEATQGLGGQTLHVPSSIIPAILEANLIKLDGNRYVTAMGATVSPGPGYPSGPSETGENGAGPFTPTSPGPSYAGNDLGEAWVYITGPVEYSFDELVILPDEDERRMDRRTNRYEMWAVQHGVVRFDSCSAFAALVASPAGDVS